VGFSLGRLTASDAARLNEMWEAAQAFKRMTVAAPGSMARVGGTPVITVPTPRPEILAVITANDGGTPPVHTARRKTRSTDGEENLVVSYFPEVLYHQVLNPLEEVIPAGTLVILTPIPECPDWFWAVPLLAAASEGSGSGSGSSPPRDFEAGGPGWVAGLCARNCLKLTVSATYGICEGVDQSQVIPLTSADGATWDSACDFQYCPEAGSGSGSGSGSEPGGLAVVFTRDGGQGLPKLTLGGTRLIYAGAGRSGGVPYVEFAGGGDLCGGCPPPDADPCAGSGSGSSPEPNPCGTDGGCGSNYFVLRIACGACPLAGFTGPGWYCVLSAGACCDDVGATTTAVELLCEDAYDTGVTICSGPYATRAAAAAVCPPPPVTVPCCAETVPSVLTAVLTQTVILGGPCDPFTGMTLVYDAVVDYWEGSQTVSGQTLTVQLECIGAGPTWEIRIYCNTAPLKTIPATVVCSPFSATASAINVSLSGCCSVEGSKVDLDIVIE